MPRRKRKNSQNSKKPPLNFTESPLGYSLQFASPVISAANPVTVDTLYVEDLENYPWVSPQFDPNAPHSGRRRRRRKPTTRRDACTQQTSRKSVIPISANREILKDFGERLKLRFVGEETIDDKENSCGIQFSSSEQFSCNILGDSNRTADISFQNLNIHTNINQNVGESDIESRIQDTRTSKRRCSRRLREKKVQRVCNDSLQMSSTFASPNGITFNPPTIETPQTSHAYSNHDCESMNLCKSLEFCNISKSEGRKDEVTENRHSDSSSLFNYSVTPGETRSKSNSKLFRLESETIKQSIGTVLVEDTPVNDYGLRVGMRRRRDLLPKVAWKRLLQES